LLELPRRIAERPLPKAAIVSLRRTRSRVRGKPGARFTIFSPSLDSAVRTRLASDEQIILFVGRRGFASQLLCADCGFVPKCRHCGIPLVYHADRRTLECHFCRSKSPVFDACPHCAGDDFQYQGIGTQRVVQELNRLFPGEKVLRLDSDATARPDSARQILEEFGLGNARFLVGTQMVTKGFDFPRVTLCGVVSADSSLNLPDFRSAERTFQVLTQVAGRAGRADKPGQAIFQTLYPDHYALIFGAQQNFRRF
jgi:primosomal protein N' (replication factor Y)